MATAKKGVDTPISIPEIILAAPRIDPRTKSMSLKRIKLIQAFFRHGMINQAQADSLIDQVVKKIAVKDLMRFSPDRRVYKASMTRTLGEIRARRTTEL